MFIRRWDFAPLSASALKDFLRQARSDDYIALQAYVKPADEATGAFKRLQKELRDRTKLATTLGYGPRFLHSTGQLHKGDAGNGLFIQLVSLNKEDVAIPDEAGQAASTMTFGVLKAAQALGDAQALLEAGRRVIRFHLGANVVSDLKRLAAFLQV